MMTIQCDCGREKRVARALVCPGCWWATPEDLRNAFTRPLDEHARKVNGRAIKALARSRKAGEPSAQMELPSVAPYVNGGAA